jgi:hypothetical protein
LRLNSIPVLALIATLFLPASSPAHDGAHKMMGIVTMAAKDHVMMKTPEGKELTIVVNEKTKVLQGKTAMKVDDIAEGTRVVVTVSGHKPPYTASQIEVGAGKVPKK